MEKSRLMLMLLSLMVLSTTFVLIDGGTARAGDEAYLKDSKGMTLYWFTKDSMDQSVCMGGCLEKWPIYYSEDPAAAAPGTKDEDFGTLTRSDGKEQTTFRGYPLYYFSKDMAAGEDKGEGVGGVWYTVDPQNFPPE